MRSNGGSGKAPARCVSRGGNCEAAYERSGFGAFHSVRRWVVLQRRGGGGSRMAVVFPVQCCLHSSIPYRCWVTLGVRCRVASGGSRLLHECGCFGGCRRLWFCYVCRAKFFSPTWQSLPFRDELVRLVSMPQSDRPEPLRSVEFGVC